MNSPSNPPRESLFERLGAYLDQELSSAERAEIDKHLSENPEAQRLLDELQSLNQLGDTIHESMPNDAYFLDLPSRVLHRIRLEDAAQARPAAAAASKPAGFWERLFSPAQTRRWATATATIAAVGVGAWFATQTGPQTPLATAPGVAETPAEENVNDQYVARVAETLGNYGNLGSPLDQGLPVGEVIEPSNDSILQTVGFQDLRVPKQSMGTLPPRGATVEQCFSLARYCEEQGSPSLARNGYRLVFESKDAQDDLFLAAQLGYIRSIWRDRIDRNPENADELYSLLAGEANQGFQEHLAGDHRYCDHSWAVSTAAQQLGMRTMDADVLAELGTHAEELKRCAKYMARMRH